MLAYYIIIVLPQIEQVWNSNNMIIEDSLIGLLLITDGFNSPAVIISVYSDPCPTVQWMFNGIPISTDSNYIVSNPCNNEHGLTTDFTLSIITRHTMSRSGRYTALFSHIGGSATSPSIYITVPGKVCTSSSLVPSPYFSQGWSFFLPRAKRAHIPPPREACTYSYSGLGTRLVPSPH